MAKCKLCNQEISTGDFIIGNIKDNKFVCRDCFDYLLKVAIRRGLLIRGKIEPKY